MSMLVVPEPLFDAEMAVNAYKLGAHDGKKIFDVESLGAVDEIFSNIANYAYKPVDGKATVGFADSNENRQVEIVFEDSGKPYNPLKKEDPDVNLPIEERDIGGLGILIVKKSMDEVLYEYKDKKNILTLRKKI